MKKTLASVIVLSATLAVLLAGCGKKPVQTAADPFREQLAASGEAIIEINENVVLSGGSYVVNGSKTLTGLGTLTAQGMTEDYIFTVSEKAGLTIDGITIDGGGEAKSGILVCKDGSVQFTQGELKNLTRLGLRVEGTAQIGGAITDVGTGWVDLRTGGELVVDGAMLTQSGGVGIQTARDSKVTVKGDALLTGARGNLLFNNGTAEIEQSTFTDATMFLISNNGTMSVTGTDLSKATGQGILYNYEGAQMSVTDCDLHDSADYIISNSGTMDMKNVSIARCKGYAVYNVGDNAVMTASHVEVENTEATAFFNRVGSTMTLANVDAVNVGGHNILNRGGTVTATGFKAAGGDAVVFMNQSATDKDLTYGTMTVDGFEVAGAPGYGILSYGGQLVLKNGTVGKCGSSGIYIRDGKADIRRVVVLGVNGKDSLPGIQVGHADTHNTVVTMTEVDISGAYRGINNRGHLTFNSGSITNNHNSGTYKSGGGINNYGTLILNGGTITGNSSVEGGGGVYNQGKLTINGGVIKGNKSGTSGGGLGNAKAGEIVINKGEITGNTAGKNAGGIYNGGKLTITGGVIKGNTNAGTGGGVVNEGTLYLRGGEITGNAASTSGGGLFNTSNGTAVLSGGIISANTTSDGKGGGGIYNTGKLTLQGTVQLTGNKSAGGGAAINNAKSSSGAVGSVTILGGTFSGNTAGTSGGAIVNSADMVITGGTFKGNKATNNGGAIYNNSKLTLGGAAFSGNTAGKNGPDVFNDNGVITLTGKVNADLWSNRVLEYNDAFSANSAIKISRFGDLKGRQNVARAAAGAKSRDVSAAFITADGKPVSTGGSAPTGTQARLLGSNGSVRSSGSLVDVALEARNGDIIELVSDITLDERVTVSDKSITIRDDGTPRTINVTATNRAFQLNKGAVLTITGKGGLTFKGGKSPASAICVNESSTLMMNGKITVTGFDGTCETDKSGGAFIWNTSTGTTVLDGVTFKDNKTAKNGSVVFSGGGVVTLKNVTTSGNRAASGQDVYATGETKVTVDGGSFASGTAHGGAASIFVNEKCTLTMKGKPTMDITAYKITTALADDFSAQSRVTLYLDGYALGKVVLTGTPAVIKAAVEGGAFSLPRAAAQTTPRALQLDGTLANAGSGSAPVVSAGEPQVRLLDSNGKERATGSLVSMAAQAKDGDILELFTDVTLTDRVTVSGKNVTLRDDGTHRTVTVTARNRAFQLNKSAKFTVSGSEKGGITFVGSTSPTSAICVNESSTLTMKGNITVTGFDGTCETDKSGGAFIWNTSTGNTVLDGVTFKGNKTAKNGSVVFSGGGTLTLKNVTTSGNSAGSGQDVYATADTKVVIDGGSFSSGTAHGGAASIFVNEKCSLTLKGKPVMDITAYKLVTVLDDSFDPQARVTLYLDGYAMGKTVVSGSPDVIEAAVKGGAFTMPRAAAQKPPRILHENGTISNLNGEGAGTPEPVKPSNEPQANLYDANGTLRTSGSFYAMMNEARNGETLELFDDVTIVDRFTLEGRSVTIRDDGNPRTITVSSTNRAFHLNKGGLTVIGTEKGGLTFKGKSSASVAICVNSSSSLTMKGNVTVTGFKCSNTGDTAGGAFIWNTNTGTTVLDGVTFKGNSSVKNGSAVYSAGGVLTLKNVTASENTAASGQDIHVSGSTQLTIEGGSFTSGTGKGNKASVYVNDNCDLILKGKVVADMTVQKIAAQLADDFDPRSRVTLYPDSYTAGKQVLRGSADVIRAAVNGGAFTLPAADDRSLLESGKLN